MRMILFELEVLLSVMQLSYHVGTSIIYKHFSEHPYFSLLKNKYSTSTTQLLFCFQRAGAEKNLPSIMLGALR